MMRPALSGDTVESGRPCCRQAKCKERTMQGSGDKKGTQAAVSPAAYF